MSWSFIARDCRHVNFDVEPVRAPVFGEIRFAVGRNLNSRDPSSRVFPTSVEGATCIMSFI
jgi:hypothetical protein